MMRSAEHVFVGLPGPDLDAATEALLTEHRPGGVVLFQRNIQNAEQLTGLVAAVRQALPEVILAIDAEGGRVDRLKEIVGRIGTGWRASSAGMKISCSRRRSASVCAEPPPAGDVFNVAAGTYPSATFTTDVTINGDLGFVVDGTMEFCAAAASRSCRRSPWRRVPATRPRSSSAAAAVSSSATRW